MAGRGRELAASWAQVAGGIVLLASLFLTWSHQYPGSVMSLPGFRIALGGVPRDASAWQVYSAVDVLLALLAVAVAGLGLAGIRGGTAPLLGAVVVALAFVAHAIAVPPTNGADVVVPGRAGYLAASATAGPGETVAMLGLVAALGGLLLSAYPRSADVDRHRREAPRAAG